MRRKIEKTKVKRSKNIKHPLKKAFIIQPISGKGGTGKSTFACNTGAMMAKDYTTGIIDADLHASNLSRYLGLYGKKMDVQPYMLYVPLKFDDLQVFSIGNIIRENNPCVWDEDKVKRFLIQSLISVKWKRLDYLVIDNPPGSSVEVKTFAEIFKKKHWVIIVSTGEAMTLDDTEKAIKMCRAFKINILGIVDNYAGQTSSCCDALVVCSKCSKQQYPFERGGVKRLARKYKIKYLGSIPFNHNINKTMVTGSKEFIYDKYPVFDVIKKEIESKQSMFRKLSIRITRRLYGK